MVKGKFFNLSKRDHYKEYLNTPELNKSSKKGYDKIKQLESMLKRSDSSDYSQERDGKACSKSLDENCHYNGNLYSNRSIKLPTEKYSGNGPLDIFIARLEDYAKLNGWNKNEMALILRTSLTGPGSTFTFRSVKEI